MNMTSGTVLNIHKMARHDGPGIRTLVLMKGCPLGCLWCSTPESQSSHPEVFIAEYNCRKCGKCVAVCPLGVRTLDGIDHQQCDDCGQCADVCLYGGLEMKGSEMTADELFKEIERESVGYRRSGGGVTFGGGEPTVQADFVAEVLSRCQRVFYHTAVETCGMAKWENLEKILNHVDLLYFDIKHMDEQIHRKITGGSNRVILDNAQKASERVPMIVRIPVIPGLNDSEENIRATSRFVSNLGDRVQRLELLPYHNLGELSYTRLGREYTLKGFKPHTEEFMDQLLKIAESNGIKVRIGG